MAHAQTAPWTVETERAGEQKKAIDSARKCTGEKDDDAPLTLAAAALIVAAPLYLPLCHRHAMMG